MILIPGLMVVWVADSFGSVTVWDALVYFLPILFCLAFHYLTNY